MKCTKKAKMNFFFTTHFTENVVNCSKTGDYNECDRSYYKDYFTIGAEGMNLGFDHFYTTSFEEGSNLRTLIGQGIDTYIKDEEGNQLAYFESGRTIMMNVSQWLNLTGVSLDDFNEGTNPSLSHPFVPEPTQALFRLSGLEIIIKVSFHNMRSVSGYETTTSEITLQANEGWSSKGSKVTYISYPNISNINNTYSYVDRYRYGIKFKFVISGIMGNFNINNLVNHLTSGIVLLGLSSSILSRIIIFSRTKYGKYYKKLRYTQKSIAKPSESTIQNLNISLESKRAQNSLRRRKKTRSTSSISRWHEDVYLDSESSFDYSQVSENRDRTDNLELENSDFPVQNKLPDYQHETSI